MRAVPVCIYERWGQLLIRSRSSLTGERVKTSPEFKKTMEYAILLARASRIASRIYKDSEVKARSIYQNLTGKAMRLLKEGHTEEQVVNFLSLKNNPSI